MGKTVPRNHYKDAINRRLYKRLIIEETAIHRVFCLNRTVLILFPVPNPQSPIPSL
ncbi:hypothetical protein [Nostoc sp.]|uniref:hypothetical protein n=1 Tax=Nostoc sp. TaxID=1180 RepID=UPI002FF9C85B